MRGKKPGRSSRVGLPLGLLFALAVGGAATSQELQDPAGQAVEPALELAKAAGCDPSTHDVVASSSAVLYSRAPGAAHPKEAAPTLEEAVLGWSDSLADDGFVFSPATLEAAAAVAETDTSPIQVQLPGVMIHVMRWPDGWYTVSGVTQLFQCA